MTVNNSHYNSPFDDLANCACQIRDVQKAEITTFLNQVNGYNGFTYEQLDLWVKIRDTITYEDLFTITETGSHKGDSFISILAEAASVHLESPGSQNPIIDVLNRFGNELTTQDYLNTSIDTSKSSLLYKLLNANLHDAQLPLGAVWQKLLDTITAADIYRLSDADDAYDSKDLVWLLLFETTSVVDDKFTPYLIDLLINDFRIEHLSETPEEEFSGVSALWLLTRFLIKYPQKFAIFWEKQLTQLSTMSFLSLLFDKVAANGDPEQKVQLVTALAKARRKGHDMPFQLVHDRLTNELDTLQYTVKSARSVLLTLWNSTDLDSTTLNCQDFFSKTLDRVKQQLSRSDFLKLILNTTPSKQSLLQKFGMAPKGSARSLLKVWGSVCNDIACGPFLESFVGHKMIARVIKVKEFDLINEILVTMPGSICLDEITPEDRKKLKEVGALAFIDLRNRFFNGLQQFKSEEAPRKQNFEQLLTLADSLRYHGYSHGYYDLACCSDKAPSSWKIKLNQREFWIRAATL